MEKRKHYYFMSLKADDVSCKNNNGGIFLEEAKGAFCPPELCFNDKIDFNMIKVLPPSFRKTRFALP